MKLKGTYRLTLTIGVFLAMSFALGSCGKKDNPTSPDENVKYPRQYPRPM